MQYPKYPIIPLIAATAVSLCSACYFPGANAAPGGDNDFNFSTLTRDRRFNPETPYAAPEPDAPDVPDRIGERRDQPGSVPAQAGDQAGQAAKVGQQAGQSAEADDDPTQQSMMNVETTDQVPPESSWEFKYGPAPNSVSNVPGVSPNSPNGSSNFFGTGGRPLRLFDAR